MADPEIVEMKNDIRDIKHTLDDNFYHGRQDYEKRILDAIDDDPEVMKILLAIDCKASAREIERNQKMKHTKCWRALDRLERAGIIFKHEETKQGSTVYCKIRWYRQLRMDDLVQKKLDALISEVRNSEVSRS